MKIAVYTIALNEEKHVRQWFDSAKDADLLLIADTGSTDGTVELARSLGIDVHSITVNPFRFDLARNISLSLIPADFDLCIAIDMDETLSENWREVVEEAYKKGINWPTYKYVVAWNEITKEILNEIDYFKIHPRKNFEWVYPIHEIVQPIRSSTDHEYDRTAIEVKVWHRQDHSKSRSQYMDLLKVAVQEQPHSWRMNHYLNREYFYQRDWHEVILSAEKALAISGGWDVERASTCMWASEAAWSLGYREWAREWARRGTKEAPHFYEAWHWLANICNFMGEWTECLFAAKRIDGLSRQSHHLVKPEVWQYWGYDLAALSANALQMYETAVFYGEKALAGLPDDTRLYWNLEAYKRALNDKTNTGPTALQGVVAHEPPKILVSILAKNKELTLPYYLETLLNWDYPKERMILFIKTNDNRDKTKEILDDWLASNSKKYLKIIYTSDDIDPEIRDLDVHDWNPRRFKVLGAIREQSLKATLDEECDFYFISDVDNYLRPETLRELVSWNKEIVAPLLKIVPDVPSQGQASEASATYGEYYSNYHYKVDENGYYFETPEYYLVWNQQVKGLVNVELVHCTYLIRSDLLSKLYYLDQTDRFEYVIFGESARKNNIPQYIDNRKVWGYLTLSENADGCRDYLNRLGDMK